MDLGVLFRKRTEVSRFFVTGLSERHYLRENESPLSILVSYTLALVGTKLIVTPLEVSERVAQILGSEGVARLEQGTSVLFDIAASFNGRRALWAGLKTDVQILLPAIVFENLMYSVLLPVFGFGDDEEDIHIGKDETGDEILLGGQIEPDIVRQLPLTGENSLVFSPEHMRDALRTPTPPPRAPMLFATGSADGDRDIASAAASQEVLLSTNPDPQASEEAPDDDKDGVSGAGEESGQGTGSNQEQANREHSSSDGTESWMQSDDDVAAWWPSGSGSVQRPSARTRRMGNDEGRSLPSAIDSTIMEASMLGSSADSARLDPGDRPNRVNAPPLAIRNASKRFSSDLMDGVHQSGPPTPVLTAPVSLIAPSPQQSSSGVRQTLTSFLFRRLGRSKHPDEQAEAPNPQHEEERLDESQEVAIIEPVGDEREGESTPTLTEHVQADSDGLRNSSIEAFFQSDPEPLATSADERELAKRISDDTNGNDRLQRPLSVVELDLDSAGSVIADGDELKHSHVSVGSRRDWIVGAFAKLSSTVATHPLRVLRQRQIAVQCGVGNVPASAATLSDCLRDTIASRHILALRCGFWPSAVQSVIYIALKEFFLRRLKFLNEYRNPRDPDRVAESERVLLKYILFEYASGFIAENMLYPMTVVIRRLQVAYRVTGAGGLSGRSHNSPAVAQRSFWALCADIFQREGWRGFFAGFSYHLLDALAIYGSTFVLFFLWRRFFRLLAVWRSGRRIPDQPHLQGNEAEPLSRPLSSKRRSRSWSTMDEAELRNLREQQRAAEAHIAADMRARQQFADPRRGSQGY